MKKRQNNLKEYKESNILQTKADKIIFGISLALYTVIMFLELKFTPHHNTISSSVATFGISTFLVSKAIHIKKTKQLIFTKDKLLWLLMPVAAVILTASGCYWLVSEYLI